MRVILSTYPLLTESMTYDSMFFFLPNGIKDIFEQAAIFKILQRRYPESFHYSHLKAFITEMYDTHLSERFELLNCEAYHNDDGFKQSNLEHELKWINSQKNIEDISRLLNISDMIEYQIEALIDEYRIRQRAYSDCTVDWINRDMLINLIE